ncbi:MAG: hypothetical protein KIT11_02935 [Fimbriimonadaceae bacterium]|nr:hypothetical protein [Fimbriimonadaceae bacterium]QYK54677.1 MAG: hypothetical protein KF733_06590 [Fimbriimonadaceae bacterium]
MRVAFFGGLRVVGERPVEFSNRRVASLFAYLALRPEPVSRELAALAIWPGDREAALASLRNALPLLRRDLSAAGIEPETLMVIERASVGLASAAFESDLADLRAAVKESPEDLVARLRVCAGPFLPEFEELWAEAERERAYHDVRRAVEGGCKTLAGEWLDLLRHLSAELPDDEERLRWLMEALLAEGETGEALRRYRRFEAQLRKRLAVSPSRATVLLARTARRQASRPSLQSHLPGLLPPLIGRERELEALRGTAGQGVRCQTLLGTGGVGKTRLAQELAVCFHRETHHPTWFVDLSSITDADAILPTVAQVVVPDADGGRPLDALREAVGDQQSLVILDNLEQIGPGAAGAVNALLQACTRIAVVATTRTALGVPGEVVHRLEPLPLPMASEEAPSVLLYRQRAEATQGRPVIGAETEIAELVTRLEGLPLAICLAAAHADVLTPAETLAQLEDRFRLLRDERSDWPVRHRRLWSCIEWSYRMVPEAHALLDRLAHFRAGWTLATAQSTVPDRPVAPLMQALLRSSLVHEMPGEARRFTMYESVREFVLALAEPDGRALARADFARAMREWIEDSRLRQQPYNEGYMSERQAEYENLRAAFEWSLEHRPDWALDITNGLAYYWWSRTMNREGRGWFERAIAAAPDVSGEALAMAYRGLSTMLVGLGEYKAAVHIIEAGLRRLPSETSPNLLGRYYNSYGNAAMHADVEAAVKAFDDGIAVLKEAGEVPMANALLGNKGLALYLAGHLEEAEAILSTAVTEAAARDNDDWTANHTHHWGLVALVRQDWAKAAERFAQARALVEKHGIDPAHRAWLHDAALAEIGLGRLGEAWELIRRSAGQVGKARGREQMAECVAAAARWYAATGYPFEAVSLLGYLSSQGLEPQRSKGDPVPDLEGQIQALRSKLTPDEFRLATKAYEFVPLEDLLLDISERDASP